MGNEGGWRFTAHGLFRLPLGPLWPVLVLLGALAGSVHADDAGFSFAAGAGCNGDDVGLSIATDKAGNVYLTGSFQHHFDFDPGPGETELFSAGGLDIFVTKFDSAGTFVWARRMGDAGDDICASLALDSNGNICVAGEFIGTVDFDPGAGTAELTSAGGLDAFVCKLNPDGEFIWALAMGSTDTDRARAIAVDNSDNVLTTGAFIGTVDFDPGAGTANLTSADAAADVFVQQLDSSGAFIWAQALSGAGADEGRGIATDSSRNVLVTGSFTGTTDFNPGSGTANRTSAGGLDGFVTKLSASGDFVWAKAFGGSSADEGMAIAVDGTGNVYTVGNFIGTADFEPGTGTTNLSAASQDTFLQKLDSSGGFLWARSTGGVSTSVTDNRMGLALDGQGCVYLTGTFEGAPDFDPGAGVFTMTASGLSDVFVQKLDAAGDFVWAKQMGGDDATGRDGGRAAAFYAPSCLWTTGQFYATSDFDPSPGVFNLTSTAKSDFYISRLKVGTWVDFAFTGVEEGSLAQPYDTVIEGLIATPDSMSVLIKGDTSIVTSSETLIIDQPVTLEAMNGPVEIGVTQVQAPVASPKSGFISHH